MNIAVEDLSTVSVMNEYGEFKCPHIDVDIEEPCCSGYDSEGNVSCGCYGQYSIYCNDCKNEDLSEFETDRILEEHYEMEEV